MSGDAVTHPRSDPTPGRAGPAQCSTWEVVTLRQHLPLASLYINNQAQCYSAKLQTKLQKSNLLVLPVTAVALSCPSADWGAGC